MKLSHCHMYFSQNLTLSKGRRAMNVHCGVQKVKKCPWTFGDNLTPHVSHNDAGGGAKRY